MTTGEDVGLKPDLQASWICRSGFSPTGELTGRCESFFDILPVVS